MLRDYKNKIRLVKYFIWNKYDWIGSKSYNCNLFFYLFKKCLLLIMGKGLLSEKEWVDELRWNYKNVIMVRRGKEYK